MNSEENTLRLIEMLDIAVDDIDKIDNRLKDYEEKISAVGDAVRIVGERDSVIQLQQNNQHSLLELLENMMHMLEFSKDDMNVLNECDLSSRKKIENCSQSAFLLLEIIEAEFPTGKTKILILSLIRLKKKTTHNSCYNEWAISSFRIFKVE